jgi:hypothetical protein
LEALEGHIGNKAVAAAAPVKRLLVQEHNMLEQEESGASCSPLLLFGDSGLTRAEDELSYFKSAQQKGMILARESLTLEEQQEILLGR